MSKRKEFSTFFRHDHIFEEKDGKTVMTDVFEYRTPFGFLGRISRIVYSLEKYMTNLLLQRNKVIKEVAESDKWKEIIKYDNLHLDKNTMTKIIDLLKSNNFIVEQRDGYVVTLGKQIIINPLEIGKCEILYENPLHVTNRIHVINEEVLSELEKVIILLNSKS
jgi:hypothetical protein